MKLKLVILVLALQSAWLLGTAAVQEHALAAGKVILLETARVDPRDLLRGDYLILNYKISDVPTNLFSPPVMKDLPYDTKIYVTLAPGTNQFYVVVITGSSSDTAKAFSLLSSTAAKGTYSVAGGALITQVGSGSFQAAVATSGPRQFYRIGR